jgi:hypothetical protein
MKSVTAADARMKSARRAAVLYDVVARDGVY